MSCGVPGVFPLGLIAVGSAPERRRQERKFPPSLRKETPDFQGWVGRPNSEPQLFSWDGCPTLPTPVSSQLLKALMPGHAGRSPDAGRGPEGALTSCFMAGPPPCPPEGPSEHMVGRTLPLARDLCFPWAQERGAPNRVACHRHRGPTEAVHAGTGQTAAL